MESENGNCPVFIALASLLLYILHTYGTRFLRKVLMSVLFDQKVEHILLERGAVDEETLTAAKIKAEDEGSRLERLLVEDKLVSAESISLALSEYLSIPPINLEHMTPDKDLFNLAPKEVFLRHMIVPVCRTGKMMTVALGEPFDVMGVDELGTLTGLQIVPLVAPEHQVSEVLRRFSSDTAQGLEDILKDVEEEDDDVEEVTTQEDETSLEEMLEKAEDAPVVRIVNSIMVEAIRKGASDIHIEPMERQIRLRYRIDGVLYESPSPPKTLQSSIISRMKIMSNLDIAERRIPQDGRFRIRALGKEADIRMSMLPTVHGEKIVMRILDKSALAGSLDDLGLDEDSHRDLKFAVSQPHGMLLVTGPTGSGKTTTLYSALQELNTPEENIVTVEDPVEYQLQGINQVQTNADVGLSFADGLRSILRQDPDTVMIGEIRDGETASIAVQAALTGHMVLSTLHTNDAAGAIARMNYMGVEPFLISSSLIMSQAQRLYRRLCPACKKPQEFPADILRQNHIDPDKYEGTEFFEANGCPKCNQIGYKGRGAVMEIMLINDDIRKLILTNANASEIRDEARRNGMTPLRDVGLKRASEGTTTIEEVLRITGGH